jgi:small subunit ribosomal protein S18
MARPGSYSEGGGRSSGGGGRHGSGGERGAEGWGARGGDAGSSRRGSTGFNRRKVCRFCADKNSKVDYKDQGALKFFLTERGKIIPRRISGNCAVHQRQVANAIKRSRQLAMLPYAVIQG